MRRVLTIIALAAAVPQAAFAECVECSCSVSNTGLAFGAYNPRRPTTGSVGIIQVNCTGDNGYLIKLSAGSSGNGTVRTLHNGTSVLNYNLYKDAPRSTIWGDGANGFTGLAGSGSANYNVYGGIFGAQSPLVGMYIDTIVVSVEY